jgi:hypothetical protein
MGGGFGRATRALSQVETGGVAQRIVGADRCDRPPGSCVGD